MSVTIQQAEWDHPNIIAVPCIHGQGDSLWRQCADCGVAASMPALEIDMRDGHSMASAMRRMAAFSYWYENVRNL